MRPLGEEGLHCQCSPEVRGDQQSASAGAVARLAISGDRKSISKGGRSWPSDSAAANSVYQSRSALPTDEREEVL